MIGFRYSSVLICCTHTPPGCIAHAVSALVTGKHIMHVVSVDDMVCEQKMVLLDARL